MTENSIDIIRQHTGSEPVINTTAKLKSDEWAALLASFSYNTVESGTYSNSDCADASSEILKLNTDVSEKSLKIYCVNYEPAKKLKEKLWELLAKYSPVP